MVVFAKGHLVKFLVSVYAEGFEGSVETYSGL